LHARRDCGSFEVRASFFFLATCLFANLDGGFYSWTAEMGRSTNEDLAAQTANHMKGGL
jgi:hypothetical protein